MLEVLKFVFSSFWTFAGTLLLVVLFKPVLIYRIRRYDNDEDR